MVRRWAIVVAGVLLALPVWADVNSDVKDCLDGKADEKIKCVQTAIDKESQNQIQKLFSVYTNFVSSSLNAGTAPAGGIVTPAPSAPAPPPTPTTPPAATTPPVTPPSPPTSAPKAPSGIQYY